MRTPIIFLFIATLSVTTLSAQTATQIFENYFAAVGGRENIESFTASAGDAITIQYLPKKDTSRSYNIFKAPYSFHYKTYKKDEVQFEMYGNNEGVTHFLYKPYPMKFEREKRKVNVSIAHEVLESFRNQKIMRLEDTTLNATPAFAIKCTSAKKRSSPNKTYYFDQNTYVLLGLSIESLKGDLTFFEGYKPHGNLLLPTKMRYELNGNLINETQVEHLEINPELPDSLFLPKQHEVSAKPIFRLNKAVEYLDPKLGELTFSELIKTFQGKAVLIDLWASWCGPCKYEFSRYDDAYFHFLKSKNIQTVYISVDSPEKENEWRRSIDQFALHGSHLRAGKKLSQSIQKQFYTGEGMYIPRMILIGSDGKILSPELPKLSSGLFYTKVAELVK